MKLRRNWSVEELVGHFTNGRDKVLEYARQGVGQRETEGRPKKRRKVEKESSTTVNGTEPRRSTRSQSKRVANEISQSQASQEPVSTQEEVADSEEEGSVYQDELLAQKQRDQRQEARQSGNDGMVACPCCTRRVKESTINQHLDRCIQGLPTSPEPSATPQPPTTTTNGPSSTSSLAFAQRTKSPALVPQPKQQDRLPSMNYALYTEASLRKKLKELGIPNHGSKELMRKRHTEWMNLWNANCDSSKPRSKRELLRDLDTWERTLGRQEQKGTADGVMVKDFDRDGWVRNQKGEFDDLIKRAREGRKKAVEAGEEQEQEQEQEKKEGNGRTDDVYPAKDATMDDVPPLAGAAVSSAQQESLNGELKNDVPDAFAEQKDHMSHEDKMEELLKSALPPDHNSDVNMKQRQTTPHAGSIDLTSSPAKPASSDHDLEQQGNTPGRRSKFFA